MSDNLDVFAGIPHLTWVLGHTITSVIFARLSLE